MREVARAVAAVAAAYAVMAAVASAGLLLVGAHSVFRATAATLAAAVGGTASVTAGLSRGTLSAGLHGTVTVVPLGVALAGAAVLVVLLRRPAASGRDRAIRSATVAVVLPAVFTLTASAGHGRLKVTPPCDDTHGIAYCGGPLRGGLTLAYHASAGRTLLGSLGWTLVVLALVIALDPGSPVRQAVRSCVAVLGCASLAVTLAGLAAAVVRGPRAAGAALLLAPNATFATVSRGVGVPWSLGRAGSAPLLLPAVFAAAVLLVAGVLAAVRGPAWQNAVRLGSVTGPLLALLTAVAGASARLDVTVLGFTLPALGVRATGDILVALVLGAAAGAAAGLAGGPLRERLPSRKGRVRAVWRTPT